MEKAKCFIQENMEGILKDTPITSELRDELKIKINTTLHEYLPSKITIGECEVLAMCINDIITNPYYYLKTHHDI